MNVPTINAPTAAPVTGLDAALAIFADAVGREAAIRARGLDAYESDETAEAWGESMDDAASDTVDANRALATALRAVHKAGVFVAGRIYIDTGNEYEPLMGFDPTEIVGLEV